MHGTEGETESYPVSLLSGGTYPAAASGEYFYYKRGFSQMEPEHQPLDNPYRDTGAVENGIIHIGVNPGPRISLSEWRCPLTGILLSAIRLEPVSAERTLSASVRVNLTTILRPRDG